MLQRFEDDKRVLKDRLKKAKETERRLEKEKKRADMENEKQTKKIRELNEIVKAKNLDQRFDLQHKLEEAEEKNRSSETKLAELERNFKLQIQGFKNSYFEFYNYVYEKLST